MLRASSKKGRFVSQQNPGQVIPPSNTLRLKVGGGRVGGIDPAAIAKAEAALKNLASNFSQWLQDEINKLEAARHEIKVQGKSPATMETLYLRAHDLKGLGTTYGYQLITRIAASLCRLIDEKEKRMEAPIELVDAHIDAIKAAVRDEIKVDTHPVGAMLVQELERQVREAAA
jgi:chemotaxis protein histidine kinase CheA